MSDNGLPMQVQRLQPARETRFDFGANWRDFLERLSPEQIERAKASLIDGLEPRTLKGATFLDVGSGSGLFSLAARLLGARVRSFDYDAGSVACTERLKHRFFPDDPDWVIEQGSILHEAFVDRLDTYDVVYSWGVLHHTGRMTAAFEAVSRLVGPEGVLYVAIYNDQGLASRYWLAVKRLYNRNAALRALVIAFHFPYLVALRFLVRLLTGRLQMERGMSLWFDMKDWLGGYPFEVATPQAVIDFFGQRGFTLQRSKCVGRRMGCNEFVFRKT